MIGLLSFLLLAAPAYAQVASTAAIDALYFRRNEPGNLEKTIVALETRLREDPKEFDSLWRLGRSLVRRGERLEKKKEKIAVYARAEKEVEAALNLRDNDAEAHFWHGIAMGRLGETRGIMRSLFMIGPMKKRMRRVLALNPKHSGAYHVLGELYRQLPRFVGGSNRLSVENLEKAVEYGPNHTSHYPALAEAYLQAGRKKDALAVLKAISDVEHPADPPEAAGHYEDAARMLKKLQE